MISFYSAVLNQNQRPKYDWEIEGDIISFQADPANKPISVKVWSAYNDKTRDFRVDEFGPNWKATELASTADGNYEFQMKQPENGYQGYFMEVTFAGQAPMKVTSGVGVLPRTYPFKEFEPKTIVASEAN